MLEAFTANGEGVGTKIRSSSDNGACGFTARVRIDNFDSFEVGHEIRSSPLRMDECGLMMERGYVIRVGLMWLSSVFSLRSLCGLGVSAVKLDSHRRASLRIQLQADNKLKLKLNKSGRVEVHPLTDTKS